MPDTKAANLEQLRAVLPPGTRVFCILRHVSGSGMFRRISLVVFKDGQPLQLDYRAAVALGIKLRDGKEGIPTSGCGMDMGFHLVYSLSRVLYPAGHGCTGPDCPSNDHSNGDRDYTPHVCRRGALLKSTSDGAPLPHEEKHDAGCHFHRDGGYALRSSWL